MTAPVGYLDGGSASLIAALLIASLALLGLTIWGLVDAIQRGQTGWWVGILVGWLIGVGWIVAGIYVAAIRPGLRRDEMTRGSRGDAPPPPPPPGDDIIS
ncbi:MAG: hypothetical protein R3A49_13215 [Acidimicrobiia bacterium]